MSIDLGKIAEEMKDKKGNVRGDVISGTLSYIRREKGGEGVEKIKKKLEEMSLKFDIEDIKPLGWYPEKLSVIIILSAKELFGWTRDDIFRMGKSATSYSFVVKIIMRYFASLDMIFKEIPKYWEKYFDFGELEVVETRNDKVIIRIKDHKFHPDICSYHAGYLSRIAELCLGVKDIKVKEEECVFEGGRWHEYSINWIK